MWVPSLVLVVFGVFMGGPVVVPGYLDALIL